MNSSNQLIFQNGSSSTTIGGSGGGSTPSWETLFAADATFTMTPDTTFTIAGNRATATDVVTITNIGGGSGDCLQITNSGTGSDIKGTSATWSVSKAGAASFLTLTLTGTTITSTAADVAWTLENNDSTALIIGASGATTMMTFDTTDNVEVVRFGNGMAMTDGAATFGSTSNTIANIAVTNNTITTFGANANAAGAVVLASTSLTTGSLLKLELSDTANAGGFYLTCRDTIGGTNDFTVGENGVVVALGTAGSNSFTLSNGDVLMSDGSITVTDADDAATLSLTNNTVTTAAMVAIAGSGTFTGSGATAFVSVSPSGLTSGSAMSITGATANFTTGGKLLELSSTAAVAGNLLTATTTGAYTGTGMIVVTAGAATTGILVSLISTTGMTSGSLLRATTSTAGAVATNGIVSLRATGIYTSTTNAGLLDVYADVTTAGTIVNIKGAALVTGVACNISDASTGLTSGSLLRVTSGTTGAIATNGAVSFVASAAHTSTSSVGFVHVSDATASGVAVSILANALTTGNALNISSSGTVTSSGTGVVTLTASGLTTGYAMQITDGGSSNTITSGQLLRVYSNSNETTSRNLVFIVNDNTAATGAACLTCQNDATAGAAIKITGTGILGIDFTALTVADCLFDATAGAGCTAAPQTNAAIGFLNIRVGGTQQWIPYYNAT